MFHRRKKVVQVWNDKGNPNGKTTDQNNPKTINPSMKTIIFQRGNITSLQKDVKTMANYQGLKQGYKYTG